MWDTSGLSHMEEEQREPQDAPTCVVCLGDIASTDEHKLECGHAFHNNCLIQWLRRGGLSCPTCRADLHNDAAERINETPGLTGLPLRARTSYLRAYSRRARAPAALKRMVQKLRDAEIKEREIAKEMRELRASNRELFTKFSRLRTRRWSARNRAYRIEREVGMFASFETPLPALMVTRGRYRD